MTKLANRYTYHNKDFLSLDGEEDAIMDFGRIPRNWEGFKQIRDLCQYGNEPVDDKVVVRYSGPGYGVSKYVVVSNPIHMPLDLIALFCDGGNLCFGYHMNGNEEICVHTD